MEAQMTIESSRNTFSGRPDVGEGPRADLQPLRNQARGRLQAGMNAIDNVMSRDSQQMLRASQQAGGQ